MRLKYQLFLSLLISSGLLIMLMYAFNSWSFDRGFLSYLNKAEEQKLSPMIDDLAARFERSGSWDWLRDEPSAWDSLLEDYTGARPMPYRPPGRPPEPRRPPPSAEQAQDGIQQPGPSKRSSTILSFATQLVVADADKTILIGPDHRDPDTTDRTWLPIQSSDRTIGYLGFRQIRQLSGELDKVFAAQQRKSFAYASLFMVMLSGLLAVLLAARIVRPILTINGAVNRISQGEFTFRTDTERRDEIGDLSRNINRLAATLDQNLSARQQWLAEISHELRTPVAILQGELEGLIDGVIPLDDAAIASLHGESLRLSRLIDDLHSLTLSDIGALDYHFDTLDVASLISARCQAGNPVLSSCDITLDIALADAPLLMRADRQRLEQLFDNLLQNSARYTDPGGRLRIRMEVSTVNLHIHWEDSSPGVSDEQLPLLFDALYRGELSRNRETGGAGLGLAIAMRIVEAHEGSMSASHSTLGGLLISIHLPLLPVKNT